MVKKVGQKVRNMLATAENYKKEEVHGYLLTSLTFRMQFGA